MAKKITLIVVGVLLLLCGLGVTVPGILITAVTGGDGTIETGYHNLTTETPALVSSAEQVTQGSSVSVSGLGTTTITFNVRSSGQPVFIGIARASDVERYLAGAQYDRITDIDADPFSVTYRRVEGSAQPAPPTEQNFWRVEASGSGTQTITWPLEAGEWSAVAMNADGSREVTVDAQFGARVSSLVWVAIASLVMGFLILIGGAALIYFGARRRRPAPEAETSGV